jgi:hypothetical protein
VTGLRADGIILLADEDCSKDLILDTYGADPTLVSSLAASSNILYDNVYAANITTKTAAHGPHINASCDTFLPLGFTAFESFSMHCSTDSPELYSNVNKTLSVDLFLASGSIILTYGLQCVCVCPLLALLRLECIRL